MAKTTISKKIIIGASALFVFVLFRPVWEQLISASLVKPLMSYISPTIINDIVIGAIAFAIAAWAFVKLNGGFIFASRHLLLMIFPSVVYSAYRICKGLKSNLSEILELAERIMSEPLWLQENGELLKTRKKKNREVVHESGESFNHTLGVLLKSSRISCGLSQLTLGKKSKLGSNNAIRQFEHGLKCPRLVTMFRLCLALNVKLSDMMIQIERKQIPVRPSFFLSKDIPVLIPNKHE